jgi:hypothetical protein
LEEVNWIFLIGGSLAQVDSMGQLAAQGIQVNCYILYGIGGRAGIPVGEHPCGWSETVAQLLLEAVPVRAVENGFQAHHPKESRYQGMKMLKA